MGIVERPLAEGVTATASVGVERVIAVGEKKTAAFFGLENARRLGRDWGLEPEQDSDSFLDARRDLDLGYGYDYGCDSGRCCGRGSSALFLAAGAGYSGHLDCGNIAVEGAADKGSGPVLEEGIAVRRVPAE